MNYAIIFKLQGMILAILSGGFALASFVAFFGPPTRGEEMAQSAFAVSVLISLVLSAGCFLLGRTGPSSLFRKEALAVIGIGWILASLVGAVPYYLIVPEMGFAGAVFESASGLTTTGASVLDNLEALPPSLHFWRCFSQWIGGLGVVVFFVAILSSLGAGAKVLFSRESSAQSTELDTSRVQAGVLRIVYVYLGLSVLCATAFWICGLEPFEALLHMFTTLSTGGFSTRSASIAAFENPALEWVVTLFMVLGGTSFLVIARLVEGNAKPLKQSTEIRFYAGILLFASVAVFLFLQTHGATTGPWLETLRKSCFQVVSIMTTTGFSTDDFNLWLPVTHSILLLLMLVGGCSGSTAGGIKVVRFVVTFRLCFNQIEKAYRSHVVRPLKLNGKSLSPEDEVSTLIYMSMVGMIIFGSLLIVSFLEPNLSFEGSLSAMIACLFNIGPGFAEVGPSHNFAFFHSYTKLYLAFIMILGRLELFALLALLTPRLWKRF